ncbi:MAG: chromate transporter [Treponemataceae bacterium]
MKFTKKIDLKLLVKLYFTFFKIGGVTFGGGLAMLPILEKKLVDDLKWTTRDQLSDYYAISQITPGIIAVNVATFLGCNLAGILGGIFATLGVISPSIIIITLIARFIESFSEIEWVQKALSGINIAVACLLTQAFIKFAKNGLKSCNIALGIILMSASFCLIVFVHVPSGLCIIGASIIGIIMHAVGIHKHKGKKSK